MSAPEDQNETQKAPLLCDVLVTGGGPAGCSLAALLGKKGLSCLCIDQDDPALAASPSFDIRTTALSAGSQKLLAAAGVWDQLSPEEDLSPLKTILIYDGGKGPLLTFRAQDVNVPAFGWIVENSLLRKALFETLGSLPCVTHIAPSRVIGYSSSDHFVTAFLENGNTVQASLVIGADGRNSFTRQSMGIKTRRWSYNQAALICCFSHDHPHDGTAIEDFRPQGPLAILPMTRSPDGCNRSALVWTQDMKGRKTPPLMSIDSPSFIKELEKNIPALYGKIYDVSPRKLYPLGFSHAHSYISHRMTLVADAAHGIHPIAGQGLNLGLRDVAVLSDLVGKAFAEKKDIGGRLVLETYQEKRRIDSMTMAAMTDGLNHLFSNKSPPLKYLRRMGLHFVGKSLRAQRFFMEQAMGKSHILPFLD